MAMACSPDEQKAVHRDRGRRNRKPGEQRRDARDVVALHAVRLPAAENDVFDFAGSSCGVLRRTSWMQWAARSSGRVILNEPRNDFASPVRELATTTASLM